jgi:hypothetical protein
MKINYYTDPGHGWFKVNRSLLHKLDIADKITNYSKQRGEYVYLEEDCDFSTFAKAYEKAGGQLDLIYNHTNKPSKIRSYVPFSSNEFKTRIFDSLYFAN